MEDKTAGGQLAGIDFFIVVVVVPVEGGARFLAGHALLKCRQLSGRTGANFLGGVSPRQALAGGCQIVQFCFVPSVEVSV